MQHFHEEFQTEIVDQEVYYGNHQVPDNLRSAAQCGARETDVARHPEACKEGDGKLEDESGDMGREGQKCNVSVEKELAEIEHFGTKNEVIKNIIQHPFQSEVEAATSRVTKQFQTEKLAEGRIEEVDDRGQSAFNP